jgi:hypothetical protein
MFGHFYHGTLEKVTKAFGTLFNRIYVVKYDTDGKEVERNLVPINYANRHAYIARLESQPELEDLVAVEAIFPRMAFEITGMYYDSTRKLNTIHRRTTDLGEDLSVNSTYQSVAYNVDFGLTIVAKHVVDANQILEQILPYFTPAYTIKINAIPEMGFEENIAIELRSISPSDNYQQELEIQQRQVRFDLSFTAKINFHGPIDRAGVIKQVQVDFHTPKDLDDEALSKTPRRARSTTTTNPPDANPGDDFGYTETWQEFVDNKKFNPETGTDEEIPE